MPTTLALLGDDLWAVNARFGTDPGPETEYWITRLDAIEGSDGDEGSGPRASPTPGPSSCRVMTRQR